MQHTSRKKGFREGAWKITTRYIAICSHKVLLLCLHCLCQTTEHSWYIVPGGLCETLGSGRSGAYALRFGKIAAGWQAWLERWLRKCFEDLGRRSQKIMESQSHTWSYNRVQHWQNELKLYQLSGLCWTGVEHWNHWRSMTALTFHIFSQQTIFTPLHIRICSNGVNIRVQNFLCICLALSWAGMDGTHSKRLSSIVFSGILVEHFDWPKGPKP